MIEREERQILHGEERLAWHHHVLNPDHFRAPMISVYPAIRPNAVQHVPGEHGTEALKVVQGLLHYLGAFLGDNRGIKLAFMSRPPIGAAGEVVARLEERGIELAAG